MKYFFKQLLIFTLPIFLVLNFCFILDFIYHKLISSFKLNEGINKLIIGDSHTQLAIDDKLLPNSQNLCQSAEGLIFTYYKLNFLLNTNNKIDSILLGFSYHSLSSYYNRTIFNPSITANYFFILPANVQFEFIAKNNMNIFTLLQKSIKQGVTNLFTKQNYSCIGNYDIIKTDSIMSEKTILERINDQYYTNGKINDFSESNLYYYNQIVKLCKSKVIKLIILSTPMHPNYKGKIPCKFQTKLSSLTNNPKNLFIDFDGLKLDDIDFLPDGDHLARTGAEKTTNYLIWYFKKNHQD